MVDPVNVPGTDREYPNWQRKISTNIEDMVGRSEFDETFAAVRQARGA
jgi:4-alpha-glucanotransferase